MEAEDHEAESKKWKPPVKRPLVGMKVALHDLAVNAVAAYDVRLQDEFSMLAFGRTMESLRAAVSTDLPVVPPLPETLPAELQAMTHISKVLGVLSEPARFRTILIVALALAPDAFSEREYAALMARAKSR